MRDLFFRLIRAGKVVGYEKHDKGEIYHKRVNNNPNQYWFDVQSVGMAAESAYPNYIKHDHKDQHSGRIDKGGAEIWEGDIMFFGEEEGLWSNQVNSTVKVTYPFVCGNVHLGEVIGNVHENPELLSPA